jgi:hypothetical protein
VIGVGRELEINNLRGVGFVVLLFVVLLFVVLLPVSFLPKIRTLGVL